MATWLNIGSQAQQRCLRDKKDPESSGLHVIEHGQGLDLKMLRLLKELLSPISVAELQPNLSMIHYVDQYLPTLTCQ